ncbi:MAG: peroxisome biogenesis factor 10 [Vezdaea acicularis]|nr:MAG: peroxisome biogenesis factor 10 [Vezdaea acicularis]
MTSPNQAPYEAPNKSLGDPPSYSYDFAAAPDIIRSNEKDAYFQGVLLEQFSSILRRLYGVRFVHKFAFETKTLTELLYFGLTTFIGNRTLGEEYCDIVQVEGESGRLPSVRRRGGYILSSILLPYTLSRFLPMLRQRVLHKLESNIRQPSSLSRSSLRAQQYLHEHIGSIISPTPLYLLSLTAFYFSGSYYHFSKRLLGLRYVFTKRIPPSEQRVGYEVLGVLLVLQMAVQGWLHVKQALPSTEPTVAKPDSTIGRTALLDNGAEVMSEQPDSTSHPSEDIITTMKQTPLARIANMTNTPVLPGPRYSLEDPVLFPWIQSQQQRKCTLCLEPMKDPSATTCGHVFCWTCIGDWCREKPECPLCRQTSLPQHVLPLRC